MMKHELTKQQYARLVKQHTPKFSSLKSTFRAFVSGGLICVFGEMLRQFSLSTWHLSKEHSFMVVSILLVLLSVIFTGFQWYAPLAKWCGAGTLVPITGFANSVASPAIEYKKEGQVFGIGVKIFTIAGPVLLYGIFSSWVFGLLYWIYQSILK